MAGLVQHTDYLTYGEDKQPYAQLQVIMVGIRQFTYVITFADGRVVDGRDSDDYLPTARAAHGRGFMEAYT